ncbi:MAG: ABC transporter ATP-binding protein [Terriglobia bacterium]
MHAVETQELTKKYFPPSGMMRLMAKSPVKETLTAVDKVSLNINQGELFALLGPNGAGKTTLIKMLCTLLLPTSGSATVNGHDLVKDEDNVRASIGFVSSEERSFYWRLTGRQNLEFFATLLSMPKITAAARIQEVLDQLGLTDAADNMCYSYSSGMKQKLVIARGLLADPAVLIMDEPTKSVDAITGQRLKKFVKEELVEKEGRTVIMTTHRLEEAEQLADRLAVMNKGRLLFQGTLEELKDITGEKASYRMRISGLESDSLIRFAEGQGLADVTVAPADSDQNMRFTFTNGRAPLGAIVDGISKAGGTLKSCARDDLKLEDIFVALVEGDAEKVGGNGA